MKLNHLIYLISLLAFVNASPLPEPEGFELISRATVSEANTAKCPDFCAGTKRDATDHESICGDKRLGPKTLPTTKPLSDLVNKYLEDRFGGLCPGEFLKKWADSKTDYYKYPPSNGFKIEGGKADEKELELKVGALLDRFGSEYGEYVAPSGASYGERALPPTNLNTADSAHPYGYHVYKVAKAFKVSAGPIAAWFGQPGGGTQYKMEKKVKELIDSGFLVAVAH